MSSHRVVVGVKGAPVNSAALLWAVAEAGETGMLLVVGYACPADSALAAPGAGTRMSLLELVEPSLARAVAAAKQRLGGDRVAVVARAEPPGEMLVGLAESSDLLVIGSPAGRGWLERGSTTHYVVRHARCPVVVVRQPSGTLDTGEGGPFRGNVVVGVDGTASAQAALQFGFGYAVEHRRPLVALNVIPFAETDLWYDDELLETHVTVESAALELLAQEVEPWEHKYPDVAVKRAVFMGRPLDGIVRAADGAALLVVGDSSHGRVRQMLGSVSHGVIDRARCPVAVVHGGNPEDEAEQ